MKRRSIFAAAAAAAAFTLLLVVPSARASEEEFIGWSEVRIASPALDETGEVVFIAEVADDQYRRVLVKAFDRSFELSREELDRLQGLPLSSIQITHEAGYKELGGHTVHFKLYNTHYVDKALVQDWLTISISRGKGLAVGEPQRKEIKPAPAKD